MKRVSTEDKILDRMRRAEKEFRASKAQTDSMMVDKINRLKKVAPRPRVRKTYKGIA